MLLSTLIRSNYPSLELIFMVPKVFEPLKFDCNVFSETGGICISPRPSAPGAEITPAMPMRPFFGIDPVLVDSKTVSKTSPYVLNYWDT